MFKVLLVSVYEGGYQPITLATAATALIDSGFEVDVLDTYTDSHQIQEKIQDPQLVVISLPLFDAVHPGIEIARQVREVNPLAHVTYIGQHATIQYSRLVGKHGDSCIRGEWEKPLVALANRLSGREAYQETIPGLGSLIQLNAGQDVKPLMSRDHFKVPTRSILPPLHKYPNLQIDRLLGSKQIVGSTEMARGCHHTCAYCSVFAAYGGKVILVPEDIVVEDVRNLVAMGMTHLTFIDADWFNAKHHGIKILRRLHSEFPHLSYDITTRVDHILENPEYLREMETLNVRIVTVALEFPDQKVLDAVNKEVTQQMTEDAIKFMKTTRMLLNPTFIMFNPWVNLEDIANFHEFVERAGLENIIDPIQYETRLSMYKGSPLLNLPSVQKLKLIEHEFHVDWEHDDPRMDELYGMSVSPAEEGVFKRCCLKC